MALRPASRFTEAEQRTLDDFRSRASSDEDKSELVSDLVKSLQDPTHSTEYHIEIVGILTGLGLVAKDALIDALKLHEPEDRFQNAVGSSLVELAETDKEQVLDGLWKSLRGSDLLRGFDTTLQAILVITSDSGTVFKRFTEDERILSWQKGSSLLIHPDLRAYLHHNWQSVNQVALPLIVASLEHEDWRVAHAVPRWLPGKPDNISLPPDARDRVVEALKGHLRRVKMDDFAQLYSYFVVPVFVALEQMGGETEIDRLVDEPGMDPNVLGVLLLREGDAVLNRNWNVPERREAILPLVLATLEDQNTDNRLVAMNWLADKTEEIPWDLQKPVARAMEIRLRDDEETDVRVGAAEVLNKLRERERARAQQADGWLKLIRSRDVDSQVEAIEGLVRMETRGALRTLIQEWVQWIAWGNKALLVETAAEAMRGSRLAVSPLIDELSRGYQPPPKLEKSIRLQIEAELPGSGQTFVAESVILKESTRQRLGEIDVSSRKPKEDELSREVDSLVRDELESRTLDVHRRIVRQLADMSDPRFFSEKSQDERSVIKEDSEKSQDVHEVIKEELDKHAVPLLARRLPGEADYDMRESMAYVLGNVGGREAVDGLARAVVGEERKRSRRQKLLADYYLEPSKERSEAAADILKGAVKEARNTLRLLQVLNVAVFVVGVTILVIGVSIGLTSQNGAARVAGALTGVGGLAGVIIQLIRQPLDRIQNAMANLVQIETAFTGFIWELNLNGTYIQSQYVAEGVLTDDDIAQTVGRIEGAMNLAMNMVAAYTKEGTQRIVTRINGLGPAAGELGSQITIYGQHLRGDSSQKGERAGLIAINHTPIQAEAVSWKDHEVRFRLQPEIPALESDGGTVWVSLFVDGMETNSLPFHLVKKQGPR